MTDKSVMRLVVERCDSPQRKCPRRGDRRVCRIRLEKLSYAEVYEQTVLIPQFVSLETAKMTFNGLNLAYGGPFHPLFEKARVSWINHVTGLQPAGTNLIEQGKLLIMAVKIHAARVDDTSKFVMKGAAELRVKAVITSSASADTGTISTHRRSTRHQELPEPTENLNTSVVQTSAAEVEEKRELVIRVVNLTLSDIQAINSKPPGMEVQCMIQQMSEGDTTVEDLPQPQPFSPDGDNQSASPPCPNPLELESNFVDHDTDVLESPQAVYRSRKRVGQGMKGYNGARKRRRSKTADTPLPDVGCEEDLIEHEMPLVVDSTDSDLPFSPLIAAPELVTTALIPGTGEGSDVCANSANLNQYLPKIINVEQDFLNSILATQIHGKTYAEMFQTLFRRALKLCCIPRGVLLVDIKALSEQLEAEQTGFNRFGFRKLWRSKIGFSLFALLNKYSAIPRIIFSHPEMENEFERLIAKFYEEVRRQTHKPCKNMYENVDEEDSAQSNNENTDVMALRVEVLKIMATKVKPQKKSSSTWSQDSGINPDSPNSTLSPTGGSEEFSFSKTTLQNYFHESGLDNDYEMANGAEDGYYSQSQEGHNELSVRSIFENMDEDEISTREVSLRFYCLLEHLADKNFSVTQTYNYEQFVSDYSDKIEDVNKSSHPTPSVEKDEVNILLTTKGEQLLNNSSKLP